MVLTTETAVVEKPAEADEVATATVTECSAPSFDSVAVGDEVTTANGRRSTGVPPRFVVARPLAQFGGRRFGHGWGGPVADRSA